MKIELITWHDAANDEDGWTDPVDVEDSDTVVRSVGFVVKETERYVTLAMDLADDGDTNTRGRIPKGMIIDRKILQEG